MCERQMKQEKLEIKRRTQEARLKHIFIDSRQPAVLIQIYFRGSLSLTYSNNKKVYTTCLK